MGWTEKAPLALSQQWLLTKVNKNVITQDENKAESSNSVSALVSFQMSKLKGIILPCAHRKTFVDYANHKIHMFQNISQCALIEGDNTSLWRKEKWGFSAPSKPLKMNAEIKKRKQASFPAPELATDGQLGTRKSCIIIHTLLLKIIFQTTSTKVKIFVTWETKCCSCCHAIWLNEF